MATATLVPREYGYVVVATSATFFLSLWHAFRIAPFRRAAGIRYPKAMAESSDLASADAEKKHAMYLFNCAQRAHGNFMEHHPQTAIAMLVAGLQFPLTTTALGVAWMAGRIVYATGYTRKDKTDGSGRLAGSFFWLAEVGLYGLTAWTGIKMVL